MLVGFGELLFSVYVVQFLLFSEDLNSWVYPYHEKKKSLPKLIILQHFQCVYMRYICLQVYVHCTRNPISFIFIRYLYILHICSSLNISSIIRVNLKSGQISMEYLKSICVVQKPNRLLFFKNFVLLPRQKLERDIKGTKHAYTCVGNIFSLQTSFR